MILAGVSQAKDSRANILDRGQHNDRRGRKWHIYVEEATSTLER